MKTKFSTICLLGLIVFALVLIGSRSGLFSSAQAQPVPPQPDNVQPASTALPPSILPSSPLAEVIKLVQAGVDENIITAYVNNSGSTFNLDADKIIYLDNVGVPKDLITAMMQRDQVLQAQMAAASTPPPPAPETAVADTTDAAPQPEPAVVTVDYFNDTLSPYGNWINIDGYGRCWRPTVVVYNSGWQPYCDRGQWIDSDAGWYWNSDYAWGVTFHYGRWFHHARYGWCWWPDTVWAPSWVTWRSADDYCGWAPLPPFAVWQTGVGFVYRGNGVSVGFDFGLTADCFTFVTAGHFCDPHPRRFRCAPADVARIYSRTTIINNINFDSRNHTVINSGITVQQIAEAGHTTIRPVAVRELRATAGQPWRGGLNGQPQPRPGAAMGNAPRPGSEDFDNRNNGAAHTMPAGQNSLGRPANNSSQPVNRNWIAPGQTPAGMPSQSRSSLSSNPANPQASQNGYENSPAQARNFGDDKRIASPHAQLATPPEAKDSAVTEPAQSRSEARPESAETPRIAPLAAPASQSSGRSDKQDQNQIGR